MLKKSSGTDDWEMLDNQRLGYNARNETLGANICWSRRKLY